MIAAASILSMLGEADMQMVLLMGLVVIIAALMWNAARRRARTNRIDGRADSQARRHNARLQTRAREDIDELMIRLEELSREICGQIDTRFAKLEHVLAEADVKTRALKAELRRSGAAETGNIPPADPRHVGIFEAHERGGAIVDIARQHNMTAGEVELILSLERSRRAAAAIIEDPQPAGESAQPPSVRRPRAGKGTRVDEQV